MNTNVLCFTTSFRRPYFIYNCINNILNQSYKNLSYSVNIATEDTDNYIDKYKSLLSDFSEDSRLQLWFNPNDTQQNNYLNSLRNINIDNYDLFIKIDDDDIYHKHYIENSINIFQQQNVDIISCPSSMNINNNTIESGMSCIGHNHLDNINPLKFGMPSTYVFNRKALDCILKITSNDVKRIHLWEDVAWREYWKTHNLKSYVYTNDKTMIYNIHGKNISSQFLYKNIYDFQFIDTDFYGIYLLKHPHWSSYVLFDKKNNKCRNISTDNDGQCTLLPSGDLLIKWIFGNYPPEKFKRISTEKNTYYEFYR